MSLTNKETAETMAVSSEPVPSTGSAAHQQPVLLSANPNDVSEFVFKQMSSME